MHGSNLATRTATELITFDTTVNTGTPAYSSQVETFPAKTMVNVAQDATRPGSARPASRLGGIPAGTAGIPLAR